MSVASGLRIGISSPPDKPREKRGGKRVEKCIVGNAVRIAGLDIDCSVDEGCRLESVGGEHHGKGWGFLGLETNAIVKPSVGSVWT